LPWLRLARLRLDGFLTLGGLFRAGFWAGAACAAPGCSTHACAAAVVVVVVVATRVDDVGSLEIFVVEASEFEHSLSANSVDTGGRISSLAGGVEQFASAPQGVGVAVRSVPAGVDPES